ncbi:hypothetical protein GALMADRAFT_1346624 [Galerina marginata CBS 339.88]|uniref:Uncharacterized protein n=1 Tax=Galerina marginata (strain CBS 339.88) TaxID=685588 RepID=A0A067STH4_GALM3|nr:hypothetical protein GALMADRAFT_1346624 [Galerina marginata CBS 339.88]
MKFSIISFAASLALFSGVFATPSPQGGTTVYHCNGPDVQPDTAAAARYRSSEESAIWEPKALALFKQYPIMQYELKESLVFDNLFHRFSGTLLWRFCHTFSAGWDHFDFLVWFLTGSEESAIWELEALALFKQHSMVPCELKDVQIWVARRPN